MKPKYDNDDHMCFDLEKKEYIQREEEEDLTYLTRFNINRPLVEHKAVVARSIKLEDTNNTLKMGTILNNRSNLTKQNSIT